MFLARIEGGVDGFGLPVIRVGPVHCKKYKGGALGDGTHSCSFVRIFEIESTRAINDYNQGTATAQQPAHTSSSLHHILYVAFAFSFTRLTAANSCQAGIARDPDETAVDAEKLMP